MGIKPSEYVLDKHGKFVVGISKSRCDGYMAMMDRIMIEITDGSLKTKPQAVARRDELLATRAW